MKTSQELIVITKTYDLILWSCNHTGKFPRNHRFVLGERIERKLYDLLETLIQARYTKQRQPLFGEGKLDARSPALSDAARQGFGRVSFAEIYPRLMSWSGHARQANTYRLRCRLFDTISFQRATTK